MRASRLRSVALVVLQQAAEPRTADDLGFGKVKNIIGRRCLRKWQVALALMRPFLVIIPDVLRDQIVEMFLTENKKMIETFLLDALNPAFNESIHIRCSWSDLFYRQSRLRKCRVEFLGEHAVAIVKEQICRWPVAALCMVDESRCLLLHPGCVGFAAGLRQKDFPGADV